MKPFILGLQSSLDDSCWLDTPAVLHRAGGNTGNLAFHHAISAFLHKDVETISWEGDISSMRQAGDIALVPCANQFGSHSHLGGLAEKFAHIGKPMVALGLGAQSGYDMQIPQVQEGTLQWVRILADHNQGAPNIGVRGEFTRAVLEHYGLADNAVVLGCPSFFINPSKTLGQEIAANFREPTRIAVAAGHPVWTHMARIEQSLVAMARATNGSYIPQAGVDMVALARNDFLHVEAPQFVALRKYVAPGMDPVEFMAWARGSFQVFFNVPSWMEHLRAHDFVIGTRIHGVALGIQAGVPSLCIAHDSRTIELCITMKIPCVLAGDVLAGISRKDLPALFRFDPDEFDRNRNALRERFLDFMGSNNIDTLGKVAERNPC